MCYVVASANEWVGCMNNGLTSKFAVGEKFCGYFEL